MFCYDNNVLIYEKNNKYIITLENKQKSKYRNIIINNK